MSKLILLKSIVSDPKHDSGDAIIDIDRVEAIRGKFYPSSNVFVIDFFINENGYHISFDKKENAVKFLEKIIIDRGGDVSIANLYKFHDMENLKKRHTEMMEKISELI